MSSSRKLNRNQVQRIEQERAQAETASHPASHPLPEQEQNSAAHSDTPSPIPLSVMTSKFQFKLNGLTPSFSGDDPCPSEAAKLIAEVEVVVGLECINMELTQPEKDGGMKQGLLKKLKEGGARDWFVEYVKKQGAAWEALPWRTLADAFVKEFTPKGSKIAQLEEFDQEEWDGKKLKEWILTRIRVGESLDKTEPMLVFDLKKKLGPYYKKHMPSWPNLNELSKFKEAILQVERDVKVQSTSTSHQVNAVEAEEIHQVAATGFNGGNWRRNYGGYGRGNYGGENYRGRGRGNGYYRGRGRGRGNWNGNDNGMVNLDFISREEYLKRQAAGVCFKCKSAEHGVRNCQNAPDPTPLNV